MTMNLTQALIALLDLETIDGTIYYWSDAAGNFPVALGAGPNADYSPWLMSAGPVTRSRALDTDAGDIVVQNLSGNTLARDLASAIANHEFEGSLAVLRFWNPATQAVEYEQHGSLSEQAPDEQQATFRLLQLMDSSMFAVPADDYAELCSWRFKSPQCGSTGDATVCDKRYATCADVHHAAVERFGGLLTPPPTSTFTPPVNTVTTIGAGGAADPAWTAKA
jgi:phage-related protein